MGHRHGKRLRAHDLRELSASHRTVLKDAPLSLNLAVRARSVHDDFFEAAHRLEYPLSKRPLPLAPLFLAGAFRGQRRKPEP